MRVVIIGNDSGALRAAIELSRTHRVDVTIISADPNFTPHSPLIQALLVSTGEVRPQRLSDVVKDCPRIKVVQDELLAIDTDRHLVRGSRRNYTYDHLVISRHLPSSYVQVIQKLTTLVTALRSQHAAGQISDTEVAVIGCDGLAVEMLVRLQQFSRSLHEGTHSKVRLSLATQKATILPNASAQCRNYVRRQMADIGVVVHENARIDTSTSGMMRINAAKVPASQVIAIESQEADTFFSSQPIIFDLDEDRRVRLSPYLEAYDRVYVIGGATQIPTEAMPTRVLDMAEYVVDRITSPATTLPYLPATAPIALPLGAKSAYVEYFGMYVTGMIGMWALRIIKRSVSRRIDL